MEDEIDDDNTAFYLAKKLGANLSTADPTELVEYAVRIVREDMLSRAKSSFLIAKGTDPTKKELRVVLEKLAGKMVDEALEKNEKRNVADLNDADYDPTNAVDTAQALLDEAEDNEFDQDEYFKLRMLVSPVTVSKKTEKSSSWDVYFCKFNEKQEAKHLRKACQAFKVRNKRQPNDLEVNAVKQFLKTSKNTSLIEFDLVPVFVPEHQKPNAIKNEIMKKGDSLNKQRKVKTSPSISSAALPFDPSVG